MSNIVTRVYNLLAQEQTSTTMAAFAQRSAQLSPSLRTFFMGIAEDHKATAAECRRQAETFLDPDRIPSQTDWDIVYDLIHNVQPV